MKIVYEYPPNIEKIKKTLNPHSEIVFTYGDTIYAPSMKGKKLSEHLVAHERVHMRQQINPAEWWNKYIDNPKFRLEQELEAYKVQLKVYKQSNRQWLEFMRTIASDLSSSIYGNVITYHEACMELLA